MAEASTDVIQSQRKSRREKGLNFAVSDYEVLQIYTPPIFFHLELATVITKKDVL